MSTTTTNYHLIKPATNDFYDVTNHNDNSDIIDGALKDNADDISSHTGSAAPHSGHETPTGAQNKVDTHNGLASGVHGISSGSVESTVGSASKVSTHGALTTGTHGIISGNIESTTGAQAKADEAVNGHKDLTTGVHGVGASSIESVAGANAKVSTHSGLATGIHGVSSGNIESTVGAQSKADGAVTTHVALDDPHAQYVLESTLGQVNGTASLDSSGVNAQAPKVHNLIDTTKHPITGGTAGHVLRVTGATTYGLSAIQIGDLPAGIVKSDGSVAMSGSLSLQMNGPMIALRNTNPSYTGKNIKIYNYNGTFRVEAHDGDVYQTTLFITNWDGSGMDVNGPLTVDGNIAWHSGNDGSGSGLDADLVRGLSPIIYIQNNIIPVSAHTTNPPATGLNQNAYTKLSVTPILIPNGKSLYLRRCRYYFSNENIRLMITSEGNQKFVSSNSGADLANSPPANTLIQTGNGVNTYLIEICAVNIAATNQNISIGDGADVFFTIE